MAEGEGGAVAPVANAPVANTVSTPAAPTGQETVPPTEGDGSVKPPKSYSEEEARKLVSDRLSKERRRLERTVRAEVERDYYRDLAARGSQQQPAQDKPKGKPLAKDFQDVDAFIDAVTDWKLEQREAAKRQEAQEREPREQAQRSAEEFSRSLQEKLSDGPEKYPDFEEVVFSDDVPFTDPMVAAIHESASPRDLAYYLATHASDLRRIAKLPATRQVIEIGKIEDKLTAPPKPTGAAPPIVPNAGDQAGVKKDWKEMSTEEHIKAYRNRNKRT